MSAASSDGTSNKEEQKPLTDSAGRSSTDDKQERAVTLFELTNEVEQCLKDLESSLKSNDEKFEKTIKSFESNIKALES